jgi:hypothetical protein
MHDLEPPREQAVALLQNKVRGGLSLFFMSLEPRVD